MGYRDNSIVNTTIDEHLIYTACLHGTARDLWHRRASSQQLTGPVKNTERTIMLHVQWKQQRRVSGHSHGSKITTSVIKHAKDVAGYNKSERIQYRETQHIAEPSFLDKQQQVWWPNQECLLSEFIESALWRRYWSRETEWKRYRENHIRSIPCKTTAKIQLKTVSIKHCRKKRKCAFVRINLHLNKGQVRMKSLDIEVS